MSLLHWEHLARTPDGALEQFEAWGAEIGALGIDGKLPVVAHDDARMNEAERTWSILQWHGVDVRVLDGGWPSLSVVRTKRRLGLMPSPWVFMTRAMRLWFTTCPRFCSSRVTRR
jgi:hypothetical protein